MHTNTKTEEPKGERITLVSKKDLEISYFIGTGAGGQNKQKNATGCQMIHKASGAIGRCSDTRSQDKNRREAFIRLNAHPKMKLWLARKVMEIREGESLEQKVDKMMSPKNIDIQVKDDTGKWVPYVEGKEDDRIEV